MSEVNLLKVLSGHRISLPKHYCNRRQVKVGDPLKWEEDGSSLKLTPVEITVQAKIA